MHLTDEQLNEYLDHESSERIQIEAHLAACADCVARLSALQVLFDEIESLPDLELARPVASRLTLPSSRPTALPRSLTLAVTLQAALAIVTIILAAPFVMQFVPPYWLSLPAPSIGDVIVQVQFQWTLWLDALSQFQLPAIPEIPVVELSSLFMILTVIGVSLLWLIGNGLLLRNK
jgi:anti-sigma factor RsiW